MSARLTPIHPAALGAARGFSHGILAPAGSRILFVAGQVGWDAQETFRTDDLVGQVRQSLTNIVAILAEAGARPEHIVRMNWYLADKDEYNARLAEIGDVYRALIGRHFPAMTALQVAGFVEHGAKIEIEVTAMLP